MKKNNSDASFRDPSGFIFIKNGIYLRQINECYRKDYDRLMTSGLYQKLVSVGYLTPHKEYPLKRDKQAPVAYKIIKPLPIPFISYPYEWCFSQLKDAALLTLKIQKIALEYSMILKDASSFNIQFNLGKPVFIDTLSFEKYEEGQPWIAYKQFCEHFLAPLALISYKDFRLAKLMQNYTDGIPLDLAVKLLPLSAKINPPLFFHIYLHAKSQKKYTGVSLHGKFRKSFSKHALLGIIESLESAVNSLKWQQGESVWSDYYKGSAYHIYNSESFTQKKLLVGKYLKLAGPKTLWDIGANTGIFSRIASDMGIPTVSMDNDYSVVEHNYIEVKKNNESLILPLWVDITNPPPSTGWGNEEHDSFLSRPLPDTVLALALIHHLAIGNNLPLPMIARFFARICTHLIIEFVPKEDPNVVLLLQSREDIFADYNQSAFKSEFLKYFTIEKQDKLPDSQRTLYLMKKRHAI